MIATRKALKKDLEQAMRTDHGLKYSLRLLAVLKFIAETSRQDAMAKVAELQELLGPHEQVVAEATEELSVLKDSGPLARSINFSRIRDVQGLFTRFRKLSHDSSHDS